MKTLRILIAAPPDVRAERVRASDVISRLQSKYRAFIRLEEIVFQQTPGEGLSGESRTATTRPSAMDVVVCILGAETGAVIPAADVTPNRSDYAGMEWLFEELCTAYRANAGPPLYVYARQSAPVFALSDEAFHAQWQRGKEEVGAFLDRWFGSEEGAYNKFGSDQEFEGILGRHLEKTMLDVLGPNYDEQARCEWEGGSPFRGLSSFEPAHSAVFYGRGLCIQEVVERLLEQAEGTRVFLLICGPSGTGKSSLVKAGVLPELFRMSRLADAQCVCWRWLAVRPGDCVAGLLEGFVAALLQPNALPELDQVGQPGGNLATMLRTAPIHAVPPIQAALAVAAKNFGKEVSGDRLRAEGRLIIFVDHFEEIFTCLRFDGAARSSFISALSTLAHSGLAWVIATAGSEHYQQCAEMPELLALKGLDGQYDLTQPGISEIRQIIRGSAKTAGLFFEAHPASGKCLNDTLQDEACNLPTPLPLLQFCLAELYRRRNENQTLTWEAWAAIGGFEVAVARKAEQAFSLLSDASKDKLRAITRSLISVTDKGATSIRSERLRDLPTGSEEVIDGFTDAGLLERRTVAAGEDVVAFTHDAVLKGWPRLIDWIEEDKEVFRVKGRITRAAEAWRETNRHPIRLLTGGKAMAEALEVHSARRADLSPMEVEFIEASGRANLMRKLALRRKLLLAGAVLGAVTLGACIFGGWQRSLAKNSAKSRASAQQAFRLAADARRNAREDLRRVEEEADAFCKFLVFDVNRAAQRLGSLELIANLSGLIRDYRQNASTVPVSSSAIHQELALLEIDGDLLRAKGNLPEALLTYQQRLAVAARLTDHAEAELETSLCKVRIAAILEAQGEFGGSLKAAREAVEGVRQLPTATPGDSASQRVTVACENQMGHTLTAQGNLDEALKHFRQALILAQNLPASADDLAPNLVQSESLSSVAVTLAAQGNLDEALRMSEQSVNVARSEMEKSFLRDPAAKLAIACENMGDILAARRKPEEAMRAYEQAASIRERLSHEEPMNAVSQGELSAIEGKMGDALESLGREDEALKFFQRAMVIAQKLSASDPTNIPWQSNYAISCYKVGHSSFRGQGKQEAKALIEKGLKILQELNDKSLLTTKEQDSIKVLEAEIARLNK